MLKPTVEETTRRRDVLGALLASIRENRTVKLPDFDPAHSVPADRFALQSIGIEPNDFGGTVGPFRYQFEGEEDLLHLLVMRDDGARVSAEEGQAVASFLFQGVPTALIWLRPGEYSQHFYVGHDELLDQLVV